MVGHGEEQKDICVGVGRVVFTNVRPSIFKGKGSGGPCAAERMPAIIQDVDGGSHAEEKVTVTASLIRGL